MSKYFKKTTVINDNGEPVRGNVTPFYSPFKDGRGYNFKYKSINIKSYLDIPLPECFNDSEIGKIYRLSRSIYSDSNLLACRTHNEIRPYSKAEVQDMVGLYRTKFAPFWGKIVSNKIIKTIQIDGKQYYCFNPIYFNSTMYLPLYLYIAFQAELREHLPEWVINKYLDMQHENKENQA